MFFVKRCIFSRLKQVVVVLLFFCVVYYIKSQTDLQEFLEDIEPECVIPQIDLFTLPSKERKREQISDLFCDGEDWVKCHRSKCKVINNRLDLMPDITCTYRDIIHKSDDEYFYGPPTNVRNDDTYTLIQSDHVKVNCVGQYRDGNEWHWSYYCAGFRESVKRKPISLRESVLNVLILMFDSTSRTAFIKHLPKTYEYLVKSLNGVVLNGYNIVGDDTDGSLFPILTGNAVHELPNATRHANNNSSLDSLPFIFYKLKQEGYRTAYLEDMPWIETFQFKYNGFRKQPTDHYLRSFFVAEALERERIDIPDKVSFCVGDTPQYKYMLNLTDQFLLLDGKRFCLTTISDITHDNGNMLSVADDSLLNFMQILTKRDQLQDTLVLVMSDHGPRFGRHKNTIQGRLAERLPFVCVILPVELKRRRPEVQTILEENANRWTTPFDIHTTILDALDMLQYVNPYKIKSANISRGLSFLRPIPQNRSCRDAGIQPQWCTCVAWRLLKKRDPFYEKVGNMVMRYTNLITDPVRKKCALRYIIAIDWVKQRLLNEEVLTAITNNTGRRKEYFQGRVVLGPGRAVYEASMTYTYKPQRFFLDTRKILRINSYGNESSCVSNDRPNLNIFCYCNIETTNKV